MNSVANYLSKSTSLPVTTDEITKTTTKLSKKESYLPNNSIDSTSNTLLQLRKIRIAPPRLPIIHAHSISDALNQFHIYISHKILGQGGFGQVYEASNLKGSTLAIKILHDKVSSSAKKLIKGEVDALRLPYHKNIINTHALVIKHKQNNSFALVTDHSQLNDAIKSDFELAAIISDKVKGEEFFDFLQKSTVSATELTHIALQIANALKHMKKHDVIYRDLKIENTIYDKNTGHITVIDLGSLKKLTNSLQRTNSKVGTLTYLSPEEFNLYTKKTNDYGFKTMSWCLGSFLMETLTKKSPINYSRSQQCLDEHVFTNQEYRDKTALQMISSRCQAFAKLDFQKKYELMSNELLKEYSNGCQHLVGLTCALLTEEKDRHPIEEVQKALTKHYTNLCEPMKKTAI